MKSLQEAHLHKPATTRTQRNMGELWTEQKRKILDPSCEAGPYDYKLPTAETELKTTILKEVKAESQILGEEQRVNVFSIAGILVWEDTTS